MSQLKLTPELLLAAYATGYFPMSEGRHAREIYWYSPDMRAVFPLEEFHVPRRLKKELRRHPFEMRMNTAFPAVIEACAKRKETWINEEIIAAYTELWRKGFAHSIESWRDGELMGGLYGIALGGAFFGESMFSRVSNASKAALVHTISFLKSYGYTLFDAQYVNPHLLQFGIREIPRQIYLTQLHQALEITPEYDFSRF